MKSKQTSQFGEPIPLTLKQSDEKLRRLLGEVDKPGNAAMYYGFTPVKTPEVAKDDTAKAKGLVDKTGSSAKERPTFAPEEKIALLRTYLEREMHVLPQPVMVYYRKPMGGTGRRAGKGVEFGLDILGTSRSVGEALAIQAAYAALSDDGLTDLVVELNSVGDKDSIARHDRELCLYFRKHVNSLPSKYKSQFKCNPYDMLTCSDPELEEFRENAPKSVSYLSEAGRRHFMEVLEYLEVLDIPYRMNHGLLGHRAFATQVVFEIRSASDEKATPYAYGFRYSSLSKRVGFKKELPSVGVSVAYRRPDGFDSFKPITNPKFYFIQFGNAARLKSLKLIEMLRRERISVYHSLTKDKLIGQMTAAEQLKVPYVLIMGQKEAIEDSVVVRDLNTRAQDTVELKNLVQHLKKLK